MWTIVIFHIDSDNKPFNQIEEEEFFQIDSPGINRPGQNAQLNQLRLKINQGFLEEID